MEVLYPRCAGLDVHAGSVTACARIATGAQVTYELSNSSGGTVDSGSATWPPSRKEIVGFGSEPSELDAMLRESSHASSSAVYAYTEPRFSCWRRWTGRRSSCSHRWTVVTCRPR
jgi:hypothetical protein